MKKSLIKIYTIGIFAMFTTVANASGTPYTPYNPYQPYQPHVPVDTGLVSGPIYALALVLFVAGVLLLLNSQAIKSKINLD